MKACGGEVSEGDADVDASGCGVDGVRHGGDGLVGGRRESSVGKHDGRVVVRGDGLTIDRHLTS